MWKNKFQRTGLGNIPNNDISNSSSGSGAGASTGSIDVEDEDYIDHDEGMLTGDNMEHDGLFGLDAKESKDSDDEMMWQV